MHTSRHSILILSLIGCTAAMACSSDSDDSGADGGSPVNTSGSSGNGDADSGAGNNNGGSANGGSANGNAGTGNDDLDAGEIGSDDAGDAGTGDTDGDDDAGNSQQIPDGEYLQYSGTIDGESVAVTCTRDVDSMSNEYVGVTLAGVRINVFCPGNTTAFLINGGFGFSLDNIDNLDGDFTDDGPADFNYRLENGEKAGSRSSDNAIITEIVGNYDTETRALTGSFTGEWGPPQGSFTEFQIEGSITGTFSVVVPE